MKFNFNSIPKFCISLKRSHDRRMAVTQEFKKIGVDFAFFDAVDKRDLIVPELSVKRENTEASGVLGCASSHVELIKLAKQLNLPAICVFEDDVVFCDDFKQRIAYIERLENLDYDFFCLGGHFEKMITEDCATDTQWGKILRVKKMGGTYGYIITRNVYDFIIRNWNYNFGADEFYSNFVYRRFNTYAFVPFLVGCSVFKSEITDQLWEYENVKWHYKQGPLHEIH